GIRDFHVTGVQTCALPIYGTVVTGTVHDGCLQLDDPALDLRLMPGGQKLRVRSIHTQNQPSQTASAGQRCALNLAGVDTQHIQRSEERRVGKESGTERWTQ